MKRLFPLHSGRTLITHLLTAQTPAEFIAEARGGEADGADAIAVELYDMKPEFRNRESFEKILHAINLPFMFILYRNDKWELGSEDNKRQEILLAAAEAGAGMIDVVGDCFDPSPDECTHNSSAIEKQIRLIERIHQTGSQVLMSSHPMRAMTSDEVLAQLKSFEQRGADVVKLVAKADTEEEFAESVQTTMRLHRELKTPFIHLCSGKFATIQRFLGTKLGVAITFGVHQYHTQYSYAQPKISAFKTVQANICWDFKQIFSEKGSQE